MTKIQANKALKQMINNAAQTSIKTLVSVLSLQNSHVIDYKDKYSNG